MSRSDTDTLSRSSVCVQCRSRHRESRSPCLNRRHLVSMNQSRTPCHLDRKHAWSTIAWLSQMLNTHTRQMLDSTPKAETLNPEHKWRTHNKGDDEHTRVECSIQYGGTRSKSVESRAGCATPRGISGISTVFNGVQRFLFHRAQHFVTGSC